MNKYMRSASDVYEQTRALFLARGYAPQEAGDGTQCFSCRVNGVTVRIGAEDDEILFYICPFRLERALSAEETCELEERFLKENCFFENLHVDGAYVELTSYFPAMLLDEEMTASLFGILEGPNGMIDYLKQNTKKEENEI